MNRHWLYIAVAGVFEIAWVTGLKHAYNTWTWAGTLAAIAISMDLLIRATKKLPVGTAYAVFTGMGTAGTVLMEMLVFGEPFTWSKLLLILLLLTGVIGLKIVTTEQASKEVQ